MLGIEGGDDVRVVQAGGGGDLPAKALTGAGTGKEFGPDDLHRDPATHDRMLGQPDRAHAADAQEFQRRVTRMGGQFGGDDLARDRIVEHRLGADEQFGEGITG